MALQALLASSLLAMALTAPTAPVAYPQEAEYPSLPPTYAYTYAIKDDASLVQPTSPLALPHQVLPHFTSDSGFQEIFSRHRFQPQEQDNELQPEPHNIRPHQSQQQLQSQNPLEPHHFQPQNQLQRQQFKPQE
jgi:hypothetical protein